MFERVVVKSGAGLKKTSQGILTATPGIRILPSALDLFQATAQPLSTRIQTGLFLYAKHVVCGVLLLYDIFALFCLCRFLHSGATSQPPLFRI